MNFAFTLQHAKKKLIRFPQEDMLLSEPNSGVFAVADGITRDCLNYAVANRTLTGAWNVFWNYPRPSPARNAAALFCMQALLSKGSSVQEAFNQGNKRIQVYNLFLEITPSTVDYLARDYAGCVAALAFVDKTTKIPEVNWGFIGDCGISIFDYFGNRRFSTPNEVYGSQIESRLRDEMPGQTWKDTGIRERTRKNYRNNTKEPLSYGALTGEESAMHFVRTGKQELIPGEFLVLHTDGLEKAVESEDFSRLLREKKFEGILPLCRSFVKSEGSLVIYSE